MKTDKISFGTKPQIGCISVENGLTKYKKKLSYGILDAFTKLSANGVDDMLVINVKRDTKAKRPTTDILELAYFTDKDFKSSTILSPKGLQKLNAKAISKKIQTIYKYLTRSNQKEETHGSYPEMLLTGMKKLSIQHKKALTKLKNSFGFDDWTCA